jgi:hypothetical protein
MANQMSTEDFTLHCFWLIADNGTPSPETQARARRLAQEISVAQRLAAQRNTRPCSAEFPCHKCDTCDKVEAQRSAFGMYPAEG